MQITRPTARGEGEERKLEEFSRTSKDFPKTGPKTLDKSPKVCDNNKALFTRVVFPEPHRMRRTGITSGDGSDARRLTMVGKKSGEALEQLHKRKL